MTSPVTFQPVGPVNGGDIVALTSTIGSVIYVAVYDTPTANIAFIPFLASDGSGGFNPALSNSNILRFSATGTYVNLNLSVTNTAAVGQVLSWTTTNGITVISLATPPSASIAVQTKYQSPPPPAVLFASADYTPINSQQQQLSIPYYQFGTNLVTGLASFNVVPISLHYRTMGDSSTFTCSPAIVDAYRAVQTFFCSACLPTSICGAVNSCIGARNKAWTQMSDCVADVDYKYCLAGSFCGGCYGVCQQSFDTCMKTTTAGQFVCSSRPPPLEPVLPAGGGGGTPPVVPVLPTALIPGTTPPKPKPQSDLWIWAIIAIVVIIIIAIAIYYHSSNRTVHHHTVRHHAVMHHRVAHSPHVAVH